MEAKRFFAWLSEGALNESIVTELYERAKWKRTTINDDRSFETSLFDRLWRSPCTRHSPSFAEGDSLSTWRQEIREQV